MFYNVETILARSQVDIFNIYEISGMKPVFMFYDVGKIPA